MSGHERMSLLDALQSSLYGLQEILAKRSLVAEAAKREAEAIGAPAVVSSVLNDGGGDGGDGGEGERPQTGWLSGAQLKAFEKEIQARCLFRK